MDLCAAGFEDFCELINGPLVVADEAMVDAGQMRVAGLGRFRGGVRKNFVDRGRD